MDIKFNRIIRILLFVFLFFATSTHAFLHKPDHREQLPPSLNHTYLGFGGGYTSFPFSNQYFLNGIHAASFTNPSFGLNVFIGHYFNPYLAAEVSLMRPIKWAYAHGIVTPTDVHSIWISVFGISVKPTLPISTKMSLYGLAGLGIISRHGFGIGGTTVIPSEDIFSVLTGAGMSYALTPYWHFNLGFQHTFEQKNKQQPATTYAFAGFYYLFHSLHLPHYYNTHFIFHKNLIEIGGFSTDVFNPNINKYFSVHYLPIFWTGDLKTKNGFWLQYHRNIFHTHKRFSFDVGASISTYHSKINNTFFQAFSVFPTFRFWVARSPKVDFYLLYSIAGPTYLTQSKIDNINLGGRFTFQDQLGMGVFIGKSKQLNIGATLGHYSNGNLLPSNPGVEVPLVISVGYAFS